MKILNEETQLVPINELTPHPRNPREGDIGAIHESIEAHGFYGFVIAQRSTGHVLAGNHRLQAAKQTGATEIPTVWVDVDDAQALKILLADNRTNDLASYNTDALSAILQELAQEQDLSGTGYDGDALDDLLADLSDDWGETMGDLPTRDEPIHRTMTLTLSTAQLETIELAIQAIQEEEDISDPENQSKNGNAIHAMARRYLNER